LTKMIIQGGQPKGQLRTLIEVIDCNTFLGFSYPIKKPTLYFDAAVDYRWIYAPKISSPHEPPPQDRLSIGIIAAEELTEQEFSNKMEEKAADDILKEALKLINPKT
jgi:hypothetical protein